MTAQKTPTALGTESIGKLLMQYAVPAIIAMTASSLYNMVDSIFIGHGVGTMALSALALTFPLMNLGAAFGALVGVGAATLISVKLGQKDYDTAQRVLGKLMSSGHSVKLKGIGTFYYTCRSEGTGVDTPEEVSPAQITAVQIRFIPEYYRGQCGQVTERTLLSPHIEWVDTEGED